jgi:ATP-dependent protease Clp ATPase subunit
VAKEFQDTKILIREHPNFPIPTKFMNAILSFKNIEISINAEAARWLAAKGYDKKMGARPLARLIDNKVKSPLSRRVLFGDLKDGGLIKITIVNDELEFNVEEMPKVLTKAEKRALKAELLITDQTVNAESTSN